MMSLFFYGGCLCFHPLSTTSTSKPDGFAFRQGSLFDIDRDAFLDGSLTRLDYLLCNNRIVQRGEGSPAFIADTRLGRPTR